MAAQPGEKGPGVEEAGVRVGAMVGGAGVSTPMMVSLPFPVPPSVGTSPRPRVKEDRRDTTRSESRRQERVDTSAGLLPVNRSSMEVRGPETDCCSPVTVSDTWAEEEGRRGRTW